MSDNNVIMEHPDLGAESRQLVPRKQFEQAWEASGWRIVPKSKLTKEDSQDLEKAEYDDAES